MQSICFVLGPQFRSDRFDQHINQFIGPQAEFVAGDSQNAGCPGAEHFNPRARANTELLQSMNVVGIAKNTKDGSRMSGG
jgi:hypothetical protein